MNLKPHLLLFVALSGGLLLCAQNYSLTRARITGGGGLSTGGNYSLRGTLGQAEAGTRQSGGNYALTGGFRAKVGVIQTPDAPPLAVTHNADGTVTVSWASSPAGWTLQQSDLITSEGWTGSTHPIGENGPTLSITINPPPGWLFFRLHKPN